MTRQIRPPVSLRHNRFVHAGCRSDVRRATSVGEAESRMRPIGGEPPVGDCVGLAVRLLRQAHATSEALAETFVASVFGQANLPVGIRSAPS